MGNTNLNSGGIVTIYIPAMRVLEYSAKASLVQGKKKKKETKKPQ